MAFYGTIRLRRDAWRSAQNACFSNLGSMYLKYTLSRVETGTFKETLLVDKTKTLLLFDRNLFNNVSHNMRKNGKVAFFSSEN